MHISEGVLSPAALGACAALAVGGLFLGLRALKTDQIAICAVMAALFFVVSLIHVPVPLGSAHLMLCGITGIMLGWAAFPAIFTALALQALLFQYGGLTTLGFNAAAMGFSAVFAYYIFRAMLARQPGRLKLAAFLAGGAGALFPALFASCALFASGLPWPALILFIAHLAIIVAEAFLTMFIVAFLAHARPQMLNLPDSATGDAIQ